MTTFWHLNTNMLNCTISDEGIIWDFVHMQLPEKSRIALSSFCIEFLSPHSELIEVRCSLLENNIFNPDGTVAYVNSKRGPIGYLPTQEFFKMDSVFPRRVKFTLGKVNINDVKFAAFTLVLQTP